MIQPLWRTVWRFLKKLKIELPYDPAITFLVTYAKELKTGVQTKTCTQVFIAALFTITKRWKQFKHSSTDEWIDKIWYIHTMEYYLAIKEDEVLIPATTWMNP